MSTVSYSAWIANTMKEMNLRFFMSRPAFRHVSYLLEGWTQAHRNGSITALKEAAHHPAHLSSVTRFFQTSRFDDEALERKLQRDLLVRIRKQASKDQPILILIDDTVIPKSKPSSQAAQPMEDGGYHFDHKKQGMVYGHQWLTLMIGTKEKLYPYHIERYSKHNEKSKMTIAQEQLEAIHLGDRPVYVLVDSWYSSHALIQTVRKKNWHFIGAIKSNRVLNTKPVSLPARNWAQRAQSNQTPDYVTVRTQTYETFRFDGTLKGGITGTTIASRAPDSGSFRFFFSTDPSLSSEDLLGWYRHRWEIETFFQEAKDKLTMGGYRLRKASAIRRFLLIMQLAWLMLQQTFVGRIHQAFAKSHREHRRQHIYYVYQQAREGRALETIYRSFQLT